MSMQSMQFIIILMIQEHNGKRLWGGLSRALDMKQAPVSSVNPSHCH